MKKFLVIGSKSAITYKDVFPYIKDGEMFMSITNISYTNGIDVPSAWYSSIKTNREKKLVLTEKYSADKYPKYDNYDAIEVSKVKDIPVDYYGVMGVPITFLDKYNPDGEFEIVDLPNNTFDGMIKNNDTKINGVPTFARVLIKFEIVGLTSSSCDLTYNWDNKSNTTKCLLNNKALYARLLIKRKKI